MILIDLWGLLFIPVDLSGLLAFTAKVKYDEMG